jgi:hypothetical protein
VDGYLLSDPDPGHDVHGTYGLRGTRRVHGDRTPLMGEMPCRKLMKRRCRSVDGEIHCERCGAFLGDRATIDGLGSLHHRRKRSQMPRWRQWEPSNCVFLCGDGTRGCHGWVEHFPTQAAEEGFHVYAYQEPSEVPVKLWHTEAKVWLDDRGKYTPVDKVATRMDNG